MKDSRILVMLIASSFCLYFLAATIDYRKIASAAETEPCETEIPQADEDILTIEGRRIKLIDGDIYSCRNGKWIFSNSINTEFDKRYKVRKADDECEVIIRRTGRKFPLTRHFSSGFEAPEFLDLFKSGGWTVTTLQSPKIDTIKKYMQLNRDLMAGGNFVDNRIDLDTEIVRSGMKALRFYAVEPDTEKHVTSKSLLEKKDMCFGKGDHVWFSAWYYLKHGVPSTLADFETRRFRGGPGIRIFVRKSKYACLELKSFIKRQYNQFEVPLPRKKWFNLKLHLVLSNHDDGVIEMWQDGEKIISTTGKTLPTHDTIYNAMEVGITATPREATLLVDDVMVSNKPF